MITREENKKKLLHSTNSATIVQAMILHPAHLRYGSSLDVQHAVAQIHPTGSDSSDGDLPLSTVSNKPSEYSIWFISLWLEGTYWEQLATSKFTFIWLSSSPHHYLPKIVLIGYFCLQ